MSIYKIVGKKSIKGHITLSGSKNYSIKALTASLLERGTFNFSNVPNNLDVQKTLSMLSSLGVKYDFNVNKKHCILDTTNITSSLNDSNNTNMTTFLIASGLLKYFNKVAIPKMRGCNLGDRLMDFHIFAFKKFAVDFFEENGICYLQKDSDLLGTSINLPYPSVGATETCLFLGSIAKGDSIIKNIAIEPEIHALITLLVEMGIDIFFESDRTIRIIGKEKLKPISNGFIHGDYIEAATWAVLAAINNGYIEVKGVVPELMGCFLSAFRVLGGGYKRISNDCVAFFKETSNIKKKFTLETGVYPMLRTDLQPLLAVMAALCDSTTTIHETVYNNRMDYIDDFNSFGCHLIGKSECVGKMCKYSGKYLHSVVIKGVKNIVSGKSIEAKTVRSGMANILLSTVAEGATLIKSVEIVERGYCSLFDKLKSVGVCIEKT